MHFEYPGANPGTPVAWQIALLDRDGQLLREWNGGSVLHTRQAQASVRWDGLDAQLKPLSPGYYTVRLRTIALDNDNARRIGSGLASRALSLAARLAPDAITEQRQQIQVGQVAATAMPQVMTLARQANLHTLAATTGGLPYTIWYGDLHSQTNHSDGGGALATCHGEQSPQSSAFGPTDAYQYAMDHGLDMLMTSEHNHMFDGSTGTNASANPATAHNLFASGLQAATAFHAAHPNFLSIYGQEWGVISNGGHMNIFNADGLIEWEKNSAGQLIGDYEIAKGDYASLYTLMRSKNWIGQFNHPAQSGQFKVNGTDFGYTADGDQVMVLAEVLNSSAFSVNTTESETSRPNYEIAYNTILERGYHVAPSSDQDNHCANWGASFSNRTGVLIPNGTALSLDSFVAALRARHVFATEDKTSQIILTANGHLMGERFANSGPLALNVSYASASGQSAQLVEIFEGVPGRNGTVTLLTQTATTTFTPTEGDHFYYARITQANGLRLWSAPVWVSEGAGSGDTTAPTATASEAGSSGTITFNASASDNIGVTKVEFYVDGALKATDSNAPYSATLDSTTLANGTHVLIVKAYDAAGNIGSSNSVGFSVSNSSGGSDTTAPTVSASESGSSGSITLKAAASDNVGVARVEFYVDGALKGTDTSSPYSVTLDSTTLSNGTHALMARAYDAAGNVGTSGSVNFSLSNGGGGTTQLINNGNFESGSTSWTQTSGVITSDSSEAAHAGSWKAWLDGYGSSHTDYVRQAISIPVGVAHATLSFFLHVDTAETGSKAYDTLQVQLITSTGKTINLASYSNVDAASGFQQRTINLDAYKGQAIQINFYGKEDSSQQTSFVIDDVGVVAQ
ncbi:Ig-like domain-containing protein [Rhodanobacter sp. AS-Z3]|uniref:Ig-like domain-containing protein n=1 Tax=Rhodanobacter sp. AS-Z3 TaxID=3031330 RepID=UPI00247AFEE3|nr:Ig-like domain-containing protein [Rhodanobacter sp. AS-Z3]WEN14189.1 Ig-like domain-containing protein [Rhodanobacter sp. AS-Z3]